MNDHEGVSTPGHVDEEFNAWYEKQFKPAFERNSLDKYVARIAWFAAASHLSQPQPVAQGEAVAWMSDNGVPVTPAEKDQMESAYGTGYRYPIPLYAAPTIPTGNRVVICETCNGRGEIGGFVGADSGYQTDPCPDCSDLAASPSAGGV